MVVQSPDNHKNLEATNNSLKKDIVDITKVYVDALIGVGKFSVKAFKDLKKLQAERREEKQLALERMKKWREYWNIRDFFSLVESIIVWCRNEIYLVHIS